MTDYYSEEAADIAESSARRQASSRYPDPLFTDPVSCPYAENSKESNLWRMGYADGIDNEPIYLSAPEQYREGWIKGQLSYRQFKS